ncbi:MAG TPA: zf-HC2 domain-containing protein [Pyrinomonadaceae bacterium]|nr:zf-HC2 domain-containing protein [Pyrinomonadaceae bacterium]
MKCEVCSELLEEYLDGELAAGERERVGAHLIGCVDCSTKFEALTVEQELFAHYDREIEVPPFLWTRIAEHALSGSREPKRGWFSLRFAGAVAILVIAILVGFVYLRSRQAAPAPEAFVTQQRNPQPEVVFGRGLTQKNADLPKRRSKRSVKRVTIDESGVLSSDLGYLDMDEQDTARHIEQTQNLLRSIRNIPVSDTDEEVDVSYDKALSRRLLNENVVLRRDAEMKAKFPTKTLLADLEPFLIDIANLPDHARPEDVRVIKERVQKTEIVAALLDYQDRGTTTIVK